MLVEQAGDAFFIHDYEGKIFDVNRRACETLGYERQELLSMRISDVDIEVQRKKHRSRFWERLGPGEFVTFEGVQTRKDGSTFPVEVRLGRLDLGEQKLFLSLTRDITERKRADDALRAALREITELKNRLEKENVHLRREIELKYRHETIVGESILIKKMLHEAERVANGDTYVLIQGETGTGKELLARAIHNMSPRKGRSMVTVNCAALPSTLIESELFGREKGAFTGAVSRQQGRFEAANGSTLFLDEIGDLPLELQAKLLRVLEDGRFERLGSSETISVDVRVIAATNQDLADLVKERRFRRDLYYRLNVFPIFVPPLRDRRRRHPPSGVGICQRAGAEHGEDDHEHTKEDHGSAAGLLMAGKRTGIAECCREGHDPHHGDDAPHRSVRRIAGAGGGRMTIGDMERKHIIQTLEGTGWRVGREKGRCQVLGLKESTLRSRMQRLGIRRPG